MPDMDFLDPTDVAYLLPTDWMIGQRGAGAINFPASALLHKNADGYVGLGLTTPQRQFHIQDANTDQYTTTSTPICGMRITSAYQASATYAGLELSARRGDGGENNFSIAAVGGAGASPSGYFALKHGTTERYRLTGAGIHKYSIAAATATNIAFYANSDDSDRGLLMKVGGGSGAGSAVITTNGSGYSLIFGIDNAQDWSIGTDRHFGPLIDGTRNVGRASLRVGVYYGSTGAINTSDMREKAWRGAMTDAEYRAALRIFDELGFFQWNDAVAEKGQDARYHFGPRAQIVFDILTQEGLDWHRYAWCCHDAWEEETEAVFETRMELLPVEVVRSTVNPATGVPFTARVVEMEEHEVSVPTGETRVVREAGDRYGVRPDQLNMLLTAAVHRRQNDQEDAIAELIARVVALEAPAA